MKDAKGHGSNKRGEGGSILSVPDMTIDEMIAKSGTYSGAGLKNDPSYWHGPAHQEGVQQVGQPQPKVEWSGVTGPLNPDHQHFQVFVDQGYGTRRFGNDPQATIGAKNLTEARKAWKLVGTPSQIEKFRLSRIK